MLDLAQLVQLSEAELAPLDIALVNLICADGLPGSEMIDRDFCLRRIDEMAERVRVKTIYALPAFKRTPKRWDNSQGIFRIHMMISTLQRDFGVRYNVAKIPLEVPLDVEDTFIHGILQGEGGTCGTLPVLYAAVGRRLGYPLKLVGAAAKETWLHQFVRWDDPQCERFNIEVNDTGWDCPPDDKYRQGLFKSRPDWEETGSILKSRSARGDLAGFMTQRAGCWIRAGEKRLAAEALAWASALAPHDIFYREFLKRELYEWQEQFRPLQPPGFADLLYLHNWQGRFPDTLPKDLRFHLVAMTVAENLLKDPVHDRNWWEPMRRGARMRAKPGRIDVTCTPKGYDVRVQMEHYFF